MLATLSRWRSRVRVPYGALQPPVVQWTARQPPKLEVVGSSPTGRSGSDAEVAEAPGCEPGIRGFEFPQTPQGDSVNGKPAGSNPATEGSNPSSPVHCSVAKRQGSRPIPGDREFESRQSDNPLEGGHATAPLRPAPPVRIRPRGLRAAKWSGDHLGLITRGGVVRFPRCYYISHRRLTVRMRASQACDAGSIPAGGTHGAMVLTGARPPCKRKVRVRFPVAPLHHSCRHIDRPACESHAE